MVEEDNDWFIYGSLLEVGELPVTAKIGHIAGIEKKIGEYLGGENDLIFEFVEFALGILGYDEKNLLEGFREQEPDSDLESFSTSKPTKEQWVKEIPMHYPGFYDTSETKVSVPFVHKNGKKQVIEVWKRLPIEWVNDRFGVTEASIEKALGETIPDLIIIHPRTETKRDDFIEAKNLIERVSGRDLLVGAKEFLYRIGLDADSINKVKDDWKYIRDGVIRKLQTNNPILILAANHRMFSRIDEWLKRARVNLEQEMNLDHIITDCGNAVEAMLKILHSSHSETEDTFTFDDLLVRQRREIADMFGEDVYSEMLFIKDQRNNVDHPNVQPPDYLTALKVVTRAELCHKIFREKLLEHDTMK